MKRMSISGVRASIAAVLVLLLASGCSRRQDTSSSPAPSPGKAAPQGSTYIQVPLSAKSLVKAIKAERTADGGVTIHGEVYLPPGTEIMVDLLPGTRAGLLGQDKQTLGDSGRFTAGPFRSGEKIHKAGRYRVQIVSYFTNVWHQPQEVLAATGINGSKLPAKLLTPDDPEFPDEGRHLEVTVPVVFPGLSQELAAISAVKAAVLSTPEHGRATDPVGTVVQYFAQTGVTPVTWEAQRGEHRTWTVDYVCMNGSKPDTARWEYDVASGKVRYLNRLAKILSWLPAQ